MRVRVDISYRRTRPCPMGGPRKGGMGRIENEVGYSTYLRYNVQSFIQILSVYNINHSRFALSAHTTKEI